MSFFERQDEARRKTIFLLLVYVAAVACIILAVYAAMWSTGLVAIPSTAPLRAAGVDTGRLPFWDAQLFVIVSGSVLALVLGGALYKLQQLRRGGAAIAEMLGGRLVSTDTNDAQERQLLNIVEEMAIASGMAVPPVYLLFEETGMNAFAAGFTTQDAVVAVTQGCITHLTRDELQGVIAHEFSHILNGDMRLNIRLMSVLHGILLIGLTGQRLLRSMSHSRRYRVSSNRSGKGGGQVALVGAMLMVIGYIGVFCARIIKSAISRQREYLADASAVQFTRNPAGLSGALKKIGGWNEGSSLNHPQAEQASHLFFANGLGGGLIKMMATYPPLIDRILHLDPSFDGAFPLIETPQVELPAVPVTETQVAERGQAVPAEALGTGSALPDTVVMTPDQVTATVGAPTPAHLAYAAAILNEMPPQLKESVRDQIGAQAVIFTLLLSKDDAQVKQAQLHHLLERANAQVHQRVVTIEPIVEPLDVQYRLPLINLAIPALGALSQAQYHEFREHAQALIMKDERVEFFELALYLIVFHHLDSHVGVESSGGGSSVTPAEVRESCITILSLLAHIGQSDEAAAQAAYTSAITNLPEAAATALMALDDLPAERIMSALGRLNGTSFALKERLLGACVQAVQHDGHVTCEEGEMIRAVADTLDCPLPPLAIQ